MTGLEKTYKERAIAMSSASVVVDHNTGEIQEAAEISYGKESITMNKKK